MKEKLTYIVVFLFTLYWFFMFNENVTAFLLVLEVIYFCLSSVFTVAAKRKIHIEVDSLMSAAEKNQQIPMKLMVKNSSKLFPIHFRVELKMENTLTGEKTKFCMTETVGRHENKIMTVPICVKNCGNVIISLKKIRVYDFLRLLSGKKKVREKAQIRILPELHLIAAEITRKTRDFIADADEYSDRESGDDPTEIYQIREYTEEDSVHDIHWKLSAKSDKLLVKERGKALGSTVLIWVNTAGTIATKKQKKRLFGENQKKKRLSGDNEKKKNGNILSPDMIELAMTVSFSLFARECVHTVAWYETETGRIRKKRVSREEHIYELLNRMVLIQPCTDADKIRAVYKDSFKGDNFSTIVEIKSEKEMLINGEPVTIPLNRGLIQWEQLGITV